jgi:hypothetical protein
MTRNVKLAIIGLVPMALTACSKYGLDVGPLTNGPALRSGAVGGLLLGAWQGLITPFTAIMWLLHRLSPGAFPGTWTVFISDANNMLYDVGFVLGAAAAMMVIVGLIRWLLT